VAAPPRDVEMLLAGSTPIRLDHSARHSATLLKALPPNFTKHNWQAPGRERRRYFLLKNRALSVRSSRRQATSIFLQARTAWPLGGPKRAI